VILLVAHLILIQYFLIQILLRILDFLLILGDLCILLLLLLHSVVELVV
jgi:hypothetical protein